MAKKTIRSTFALDPDTVADLDRLASKWEVSKSAALRRVIETAAAVDEVDSASDRIAALDELQARLELTPEAAEAWLRETRSLREWGP